MQLDSSILNTLRIEKSTYQRCIKQWTVQDVNEGFQGLYNENARRRFIILSTKL